MIQIRMMKEYDLKSVNELLKEAASDFEGLKLKVSTSFVVEDNQRICGIAGYSVTEVDKAEINYIYIKKEDRGFKLGDGLLRAVLNHLDMHKIQQVYIYSRENADGFFVAEGLEVAHRNGEQLIFKAELPEFFLRPCKSSRGNA